MAEQKNLIKYHGLVSLFIGVGFLVALQAAVGTRFDYYSAVPYTKLWIWFLSYSAAVALYNRWYLKQIEKMNLWTVLRAFLLMCGGVGLFLIIPSPFLRGIFLLVSIPVIAFFETTIGTFSENLLVSETVLSAFGIFAGLGGWAFLYTPQSRFYFAIAVFIFIFLLARCFFEYTPGGSKQKLVSGLALALLTSEVFWAVGFLPQHFTALALTLVALFYSGLIINYHFLFNNLDFKKIQFHLIIAAVCVVLVFISTPWRITG